jgi:proteasome lid subunit RPN8/RPN11
MAAERPAKVRVVKVDHDPPRVRQRPPNMSDAYLSLRRPQSRQPVIFVHRDAFLDLAREGSGALPNETIGLLYGRSWRDRDGVWLLVNRFVAALAEEKDTSPGRSSLTPEGNSRLRRRAEQQYPAEECVGWAHTHTFHEPRFSQGDLAEQGRKSAECVGLLGYRPDSSDHWMFTTYLGPGADNLVGDAFVVDVATTARLVGTDPNSAVATPAPEPSRDSAEPSRDGADPAEQADPDAPLPVPARRPDEQPAIGVTSPYRQRGLTSWIVRSGLLVVGAVLAGVGLMLDLTDRWNGHFFAASLLSTLVAACLAAFWVLPFVRSGRSRPPSLATTAVASPRGGRPTGLPAARWLYLLAVVTAAAIGVTALVFGLQPHPKTNAKMPTTGHAEQPPSSAAGSSPKEAANAALAAYGGFWQAYVAARAGDAVGQADLVRFVAEPLLSDVRFDLRRAQQDGVTYRGRPTLHPQVVAIDLPGQPGTVTIEDCFDATGWLATYQNSGGSPAPGGSIERYLVMSTATLVAGKGWLIARSHVDMGRTC